MYSPIPEVAPTKTAVNGLAFDHLSFTAMADASDIFAVVNFWRTTRFDISVIFSVVHRGVAHYIKPIYPSRGRVVRTKALYLLPTDCVLKINVGNNGLRR